MADKKRRDIIDDVVELKKFTHVYHKLKATWGYPDFFSYIDSLLLVEPGREGRAGFPEEAYREIDMLKREFLEHPDEIMAPFLDEKSKKQILDYIKESKIKINFTIGDRR